MNEATRRRMMSSDVEGLLFASHCRCSVDFRGDDLPDLTLCPLHAAAPALYEALEGQGKRRSDGQWHTELCWLDDGKFFATFGERADCTQARAALASVKETK